MQPTREIVSASAVNLPQDVWRFFRFETGKTGPSHAITNLEPDVNNHE